METNKSILAHVYPPTSACKYRLIVIKKSNSENVYRITAQDLCEDDEPCIKDVGTDKELALSIVDILNGYRVPYVHFLDVINDLMNQ